MERKLENRIRVLRAEFGITQEELGQACGLSRQSINAVETGKFVPTVITAIKISKYFNKKIEEVFILSDS